MKDTERFYRQLTRFLYGSQSDRKEVTSWYEELSTGAAIDEDQVRKIQHSAEERIRKSLRLETPVRRFLSLYRWTAAAAAIVLTVGGGLGWYYMTRFEVATTSMLVDIAPAREHAVIVLENGQEVDLNILGLNQELKIGQIIIKKNKDGEVQYTDAANGKEKIQINSLRVPKAATYQLTLVDGTRVMLNSDSKLTYPSSFAAGDRVVKLEGEAYFEVTKTSNKSKFVVESTNQRIEVLGTRFNVKAYTSEDSEQTTLAEGSVKVVVNKQDALLAPNQQAVWTGRDLETRRVNVDDVLGWTRGQFCFDGTNTAEVLQEIARWYDIDVTYERTRRVDEYIGKIPRNLTLDRLIQLLNYAELKTKAVIRADNRINLIIT